MNITKRKWFVSAMLLYLPIALTAQQPQDSEKTNKPGIVAHRVLHQFETSSENSVFSVIFSFS